MYFFNVPDSVEDDVCTYIYEVVKEQLSRGNLYLMSNYIKSSDLVALKNLYLLQKLTEVDDVEKLWSQVKFVLAAELRGRTEMGVLGVLEILGNLKAEELNSGKPKIEQNAVPPKIEQNIASSKNVTNFCHKCGEENKKKGIFCSKCGANLSE
jgi:hypothetical protein